MIRLSQDLSKSIRIVATPWRAFNYSPKIKMWWNDLKYKQDLVQLDSVQPTDGLVRVT